MYVRYRDQTSCFLRAPRKARFTCRVSGRVAEFFARVLRTRVENYRENPRVGGILIAPREEMGGSGWFLFRNADFP